MIVAGPVWGDYPQLLDYGAPHLLMYSLESAIAEKFHAMVTREMANSRMKDFHDIQFLCRHHAFNGSELADAIVATFDHRRTPVPTETPLALTETFTSDSTKQLQWKAFRRKARLDEPDDDLAFENVAAVIRGFIMPPIIAVTNGRAFSMRWQPGGPWNTTDL